MQTPPGLTWLPAPGATGYRVQIKVRDHGIVYEKSIGADPVHLPDKVLEPGAYEWDILALDETGNVMDRHGVQSFIVSQEAKELPWIDTKELLARVPKRHPRYFYDEEKIEEIRRTLFSTRRRQWERCKELADRELDRAPPEKPIYHLTRDEVTRRMEYKQYFHYFRKHVDGAMMNLVVAYVASGEEKYAKAAKRILLDIATWNHSDDDVTSVRAAWGDEPGLSYAKYGYKAYDWLYPVLTTDERKLVHRMVEERAGQTYRRLKDSANYLTYPAESHNGRLISYLSGMSLVLAHESEHAATWLDYSLKALSTLYPHWGGHEGGWAEGIPYGLWYNSLYIPDFEALDKLTGFNLWNRPFFSKVRYFFFYCLSPVAEIRPYGDSAVSNDPATYKPTDFNSLLKWHAHKFDDPQIGWWMQQTGDWDGVVSGEKALYHTDDDPVKSPEDLPSSRAFHGVGWAALHGNLSQPKRDAWLLFKSSPYGSVSHSHADQNAFCIQRGNAALAIPSGYYGPSYGMPHHAEWTRATKANNCILVNGKGQVIRDAEAKGELIGFETHKAVSYVAGDATAAYKGLLKRWHRHILMLNPGIFLMLDDIEASKPATFQWLLHTLHEMEIDGQKIISRRKGASLTVHLCSLEGMLLSQTDQFDTPYNHGIPKKFHGSSGGSLAADEPPNHWHMTAETKEKSTSCRIGAIMAVSGPGEEVDLDITRKNGEFSVVAKGDYGTVSGSLYLKNGKQLIRGMGIDGNTISI